MKRERTHVDREVGARVRERRATLGLSQRELAAGAQCDVGMVSRIENGNRIPSVGLLETLARHLDVDASWLGTGEHDPAIDLEHALELLSETGDRPDPTSVEEARDLVASYLAKIGWTVGWTTGNGRAIGSTVKTDDAGETGR